MLFTDPAAPLGSAESAFPQPPDSRGPILNRDAQHGNSAGAALGKPSGSPSLPQAAETVGDRLKSAGWGRPNPLTAEEVWPCQLLTGHP